MTSGQRLASQVRAPARNGARLLRDLGDGLRSRPGRAGVAVVGVAVGAAALSLLVATLTALAATADRLVSELGAGVVAVVADTATADERARSLSQRHARLLRASLPGALVATTLRSEARTLGGAGDRDARLQVVATDSFLAAARGWPLAEGRFLDHRDVEDGQRHAVLGSALASEWEWRVGEVILLGEIPFVVVGIVHTAGSALGSELGDPRLASGERLVFVPHTVPELWLAGSGRGAERVEVLFVAAPGRDPDAVATTARNLLATPVEAPGPISWITPRALAERVTRLQKVVGTTAATIGLLCLTLAGTTLMGLTVANVRERVAEIGLRRALGATRRQVAALFLCEAAVLVAIGAVAGTAFAHGVMGLGVALLPVPLAGTWASWMVPVLVSLLFGLAFTYGPAARAAAMPAGLALREA